MASRQLNWTVAGCLLLFIFVYFTVITCVVGPLPYPLKPGVPGGQLIELAGVAANFSVNIMSDGLGWLSTKARKREIFSSKYPHFFVGTLQPR